MPRRRLLRLLDQFPLGALGQRRSSRGYPMGGIAADAGLTPEEFNPVAAHSVVQFLEPLGEPDLNDALTRDRDCEY